MNWFSKARKLPIKKGLNPFTQDGFTVVEFLIAILVFTLGVGLIYGIFIMQYRFMVLQQDLVSVDEQMNFALNTMVKDFQLLGADPTDADLFIPSGTTIQALEVDPDNDDFTVDMLIRSDRNADGDFASDASEENEEVLYRELGGNLLRNGLTLVENVTNFQLYYFDQDGNQLTLADAEADQHLITMVKIVLEAEGDYQNPTNGQVSTRRMVAVARALNR